jgi:RNA polymerase sigma factor (TIGR02999 family)
MSSSSSPPSPGDVTLLLEAWSRGEPDALDRLLPLIYAELRGIADRLGSRDRVATLQPTEIVHEAFMRLIGQRAAFQNRSHFFAIAARTMRRVLVDRARARLADKRGGGAERVTLRDDLAPAETTEVDALALDGALTRLEALDSRQAHIVELRYFGGLTVEETAEATALSPATVKREWTLARAFLLRALERG